MVKIHFGVDLDFAVNRYPEPEEWARVLSEELGVRYAQFRSDLIQPHFTDEIIDEHISRVREACRTYGVETTHTFTSQRWNYCGHHDAKVRDYWLGWMKRFVEISGRLGALSAGSRLGIYSVKDFSGRREFILNEIVRRWKEIASHAKRHGVKMLTFEHMSIPREVADTIAEARMILDLFNNDGSKAAVPVLLCLDTDQGNSFASLRDGDPYEWIREFGAEAPIMHLKQRIPGNSSAGKPFTPEFNRVGVIQPEKVISALEQSGTREITLFLEPSFRERLPQDNNVISDLKQSVAFWKPYVDD